MRVAQAFKIPFGHVGMACFGRLPLVAFRDQPCGRQAFALHEGDVMRRNAVRPAIGPARVIIQHRGNIGFVAQEALAIGRADEIPRLPVAPLALGRFDDVEHLFGVLLVLDQLAKMVQHLERAKARHLAFGCHQRKIEKRHRVTSFARVAN